MDGIETGESLVGRFEIEDERLQFVLNLKPQGFKYLKDEAYPVLCYRYFWNITFLECSVKILVRLSSGHCIDFLDTHQLP